MAKSKTVKNEKTEKNTVSKNNSTKEPKAKEVVVKKALTPKVTSKVTSPKEGTTKKTTKGIPKRKSTSRKPSSSTKKTSLKPVANIIEYYDLPTTYNQTTVKLLFQTPKKLFVYWEISEADKQKYFTENGNDFFEKTIPYLLVKNKTKKYSFEVEINDFANSWYFDVPDSNCEYEVALIRKNKVTEESTWITNSNELEVPNNRILFEQNRKEIFFKNIKTNDIISKTVVNLQFINHLGNVCNANSFYKRFYDEEDLYTLNNPSSKL